MASTSNSEHRGHHRRRRRHAWPNHSVLDADKEAACIDLTVDVSSDDIIDLTSGHSLTIADSPVEVSPTADHIGPIRTRRRTGRRGRPQGSSRRHSREPVRCPSPLVDPSFHVELLSDDSDSDSLPELPFEFTPPSEADLELSRTSSEGVKISCPVCLDDSRQIHASGRQVVSTNCGHIFCNECIKEAITIQRSCPTCRRKITQRSVHPLFV